MIIDMSPWAEEFAAWRRAQMAKEASQDTPAEEPAEDTNHLQETKGCAILDSGATMTCSSTVAAEEIQVQRLRQNEPGMPVVGDSDRVFKFADGRTDESRKTVEQPITAGLLEGKTLKMHLIDSAGNDTGPLYGIDDLRRHQMVVDYDESKVMFKDKPDEWYQLPQTKKDSC